jgi:hypothetical protein
VDDHRHQELFLSALSRAPADSFIAQLHVREMAEISYAMDLCPLQDSFRFRARYLGWRIAHFLIGDAGDLDFERLTGLCNQFETDRFPTGPRMEGDAVIYSHIRRCLDFLRENQKIGAALKKFSLPVCHRKAEEIVRETLWPEEVGKLQHFHVRRAALAAWLTLLRQTTGSCFATAPAILVQQYEPELFFKDLYDLLSTGQLRRVVEGKGYSVPLSPTSGMGDLQKLLPPVLSLESLAYAPGLRFALEESEFLLRKEIDRVKESVETPEQLLKILLLNRFDLTNEEIVEEEYLEKIQMTPLLAKQGAVHYQRPSERAVKVSEFKRKLARAEAAFRAMTECSLLRVWEYSIASFSDVKLDFARWNLYIGLGFHPEQKGGIADFLYRLIDAKLMACNEEASQRHRDYEEAISHVRSLEALLDRSLGDSHRHQLKGELTGAVHAANTAIELRDRAAAMGEALSQSFSSLIRQFDEKLQDHFQEIFDPLVAEEGADFSEDSPAGFRLVYKHGRSDASLWTRIQTEEEYLKSLRDFFSAVEQELQLEQPLGPEFIAEVTTEIIRYLQRPEFIELAMTRSKAQNRLSPWHYVSGGTMQTLIQNYFSRGKPLTEISCTPHSEEDLFQFLKDCKKGTPLLIHSPSHAFIFQPDWFDQDAEAKIEKSRKAVKQWKLDEEMQEFIAHRLSDKLPLLEKPLFLHLFRQKSAAQTNIELRSSLIESLQKIPQSRLKNPAATVDSLLYEIFPVLTVSAAKTALETLLRPTSIKLEGNFIGAADLQQKAMELLVKEKGIPFSSQDFGMELAGAARALGWSYPAPIIFADTNWAGWFFGWIVNPATARLEFWRLNRTGTRGVPMLEWSEFFSPRNRLPWVVLPQSEEYLHG